MSILTKLRYLLSLSSVLIWITPSYAEFTLSDRTSSIDAALLLQTVENLDPNIFPDVATGEDKKQSIVSQATRKQNEPSPATTQLQVKKIEVIGSTIFNETDWRAITKPLEGKTVTIEQIQQVTDKITGLYLEGNYITSRAVIEEESLATGNIRIRVIEGSVEEIVIEGAKRLENYVRSRIELGTNTPLNSALLEDQLRLLKIDPLFENVEASIKAGTGVGQSILVVRVTEANPFSGSVGIDNYSPPSVGAERLSLNLLYRNVTGLGDSIAASYRPRLATFDTYQLEFAYQIPLNAMNGKLNLRTVIDRNKVIDGRFEILDIQGEAERYEISYRQPLILTPREEFALSVGFAYQRNQLFTFAGPTRFGFGPNEEGETRTSVFTFGQEYTLRDPSGAWGFRSQLRFGTGVFDATSNEDDIPDSEFFSWLGQIQRVQVLGENNFLIAQLDFQLAPNPLLPSEQFVIGGAQSVRGYRQNVLAGDYGLRFSLEDRIILARNDSNEPVFTVAPFFDMGVIWNDSDNPNKLLADNNFIAGIGLGLIWEPIDGLNFRVDYAPPLVNLNIRGNNVQDDGFYFSASYDF
ncbi:MAG: ShlB/FhaC/HecB family hemolysin secretion/activation protein [Hydrococcus sp. Prado102]|nr:ShlB/FhaC/HecB family hemolysin secretion/activation protein [Hydrococcus sp. Prado102]